jgi:hypothetical protein
MRLCTSQLPQAYIGSASSGPYSQIWKNPRFPFDCTVQLLQNGLCFHLRPTGQAGGFLDGQPEVLTVYADAAPEHASPDLAAQFGEGGGRLANIEISVLIYSLLLNGPARQVTAVTTWM